MSNLHVLVNKKEVAKKYAFALFPDIQDDDGVEANELLRAMKDGIELCNELIKLGKKKEILIPYKAALVRVILVVEQAVYSSSFRETKLN